MGAFKKNSTKSDHVYYTLKIFEKFIFLEDENVPLVLGGLRNAANSIVKGTIVKGNQTHGKGYKKPTQKGKQQEKLNVTRQTESRKCKPVKDHHGA